jgi:hypothetical protein
MHETRTITEDTSIDAQETKELIERLSDPSFVPVGGSATVKDLAETLDMDPIRVAAGLKRLREEKATQEVPVFATNPFAFPANRPYTKLAFVMIFTALGITAILFFMMMSKPAQTITLVPAPREVQTQSSDGMAQDAPPAPHAEPAKP